MNTANCKACGFPLSGTETRCPECHAAIADESGLSSRERWEKEYRKTRLHWIVVVVLFWVTLAIVAGLYLIAGGVYLNELVFIAAIFMALGVYLKTRVLRMERQRPRAGEG